MISEARGVLQIEHCQITIVINVFNKSIHVHIVNFYKYLHLEN